MLGRRNKKPLDFLSLLDILSSMSDNIIFTRPRICRFCKHWGGSSFTVDDLMAPKHGVPWKDLEAAKEYTLLARTNEKNLWGCAALKDALEIDLDQGSGWDSGGASVDEINTPGDFGCNRYEAWTEA